MRAASALVLLLAVSGCSSTPLATEKTMSVPAERIYDQSYVVPSAGPTGLVIIKRDAGYFGLDCANVVSVDGRKVAQLNPAERLELHLDPKEHVLAVSRGSKCGGEIKELSVTADPSTPKTYRVWVGPNGLLEFGRTAL